MADLWIDLARFSTFAGLQVPWAGVFVAAGTCGMLLCGSYSKYLNWIDLLPISYLATLDTAHRFCFVGFLMKLQMFLRKGTLPAPMAQERRLGPQWHFKRRLLVSCLCPLPLQRRWGALTEPCSDLAVSPHAAGVVLLFLSPQNVNHEPVVFHLDIKGSVTIF